MCSQTNLQITTLCCKTGREQPRGTAVDRYTVQSGSDIKVSANYFRTTLDWKSRIRTNKNATITLKHKVFIFFKKFPLAAFKQSFSKSFNILKHNVSPIPGTLCTEKKQHTINPRLKLKPAVHCKWMQNPQFTAVVIQVCVLMQHFWVCSHAKCLIRLSRAEKGKEIENIFEIKR